MTTEHEIEARPGQSSRYAHSSQPLYMDAEVVITILLQIGEVSDIKHTLMVRAVQMMEGRCTPDGFVKPGSVDIVTFSAGALRDNGIMYTAVCSCQTCNPPEGMYVLCRVVGISKAGIKAVSAIETPSPIIAFVMQDHLFKSSHTKNIRLGQEFMLQVIGRRSNKGDQAVTVIGTVVAPKSN
jgi:hypothetical protein